MASLHPAHGARVVLEREAASDPAASHPAASDDAASGEVRYRVSIYEPAEVLHVTTARLAPGGSIALGPWSSEPPAWALTFAERLLKGLPKKHAADASWPRKITRWRDARD